MHIQMCVSVCMCAHAHAHLEQRTTSRVIPQQSCETDSLNVLQIVQELHGFPCFPLTRFQITSLHPEDKLISLCYEGGTLLTGLSPCPMYYFSIFSLILISLFYMVFMLLNLLIIFILQNVINLCEMLCDLEREVLDGSVSFFFRQIFSKCQLELPD